MHRNADGTYADRRLDIDIIYIGNEIYNGEIIIPHPRMHLRSFVLLPLLELTPDWRHPLIGKTIRQLASLLDEEGLERKGYISNKKASQINDLQCLASVPEIGLEPTRLLHH